MKLEVSVAGIQEILYKIRYLRLAGGHAHTLPVCTVSSIFFPFSEGRAKLFEWGHDDAYSYEGGTSQYD